MQKIVVITSLALVAISCNRKFSSETNDFNSGTSDISSKISMNVSSISSALSSFKSINIDIVCPKALNGVNDWKDSFTVQDNDPKFNVVKNSACSITLKSYSDGSRTFTAKDTPLIITISDAGIITLTNPAVEYSVSPADPDNKKWYFAAAGKGAYNLVINNGTDPAKVIVDLENVAMQAVTVNAGPAPSAPNVTNIRLSKIQRNSGDWDYSLIGKVENSNACKILESSLLTNYDYVSINQAFMSSNGAITCPDNLLSGTQGNWNTFAQSEKVIIWQSSEPNAAFSGYTYLVLPKQN
ncbi:hypothetical protein QEJ31_13265 [Pigmentibacter sp. JX0631]|uniref:hypothetical protein n=1 Tax=Pigmentibacter sp. JX0631 TaxID=2976982 RepID=UPI00246864AB|nr:hypothetical protein [Pigmentibacter sp. JX0631]WGL59493.1 hypothetical protein QEJ31_13265 [Pigmentibacter sp. JX0631]